MGVPARRETGMRVPVSPPSEQTQQVLCDVVLERHRQVHLWGHNEDTADGTGPDVRWAKGIAAAHDSLAPCPAAHTAAALEEMIRARYDAKVQQGQPLTWVDFLLEEMAEAFKEDDPQKLYTELVQVAAVAVSWCEKIRQR
jgi:hypothetical protein